MAEVSIKKQVRNVWESYMAEYHREFTQEQMDETWDAANRAGLLDGRKIMLRDSESPAVVGLPSDFFLNSILGVLILSVVGNFVYDTMKWGWDRLCKAVDDQRWQEKQVARMGDLHGKERDEALAAARWTLEMLCRLSRGETRSECRPD
jgi:hypothetical protein